MRLGFIFKKAAHVKAAQLVQERPGYLTVKMVPEPEFKQEDAAHILSELYDRAGKDNLIITMEKTDINGLIYSQSGKYRYIVNLID